MAAVPTQNRQGTLLSCAIGLKMKRIRHLLADYKSNAGVVK